MKFCTDLKVVKIFCGALSLGSYFLFVQKVYIKLCKVLTCTYLVLMNFAGFFLSQNMRQYRMPYSQILMTRVLGSTTGGFWEGVRLIRRGRVCCGGVRLIRRGRVCCG